MAYGGEMIVRVTVEIDGVREEEMRAMGSMTKLQAIEEAADLAHMTALRVWERRERLGERKREWKWLPWRWRKAP